MSTVAIVKKRIKAIYQERRAKLFALSLDYAGRAINQFRASQGSEEYWKNRTDQAWERMFSKAFLDGDDIGWFLSHGVQYGVYLETANDRQNEAIRPIVADLAPKFYKDAEEII